MTLKFFFKIRNKNNRWNLIKLSRKNVMNCHPKGVKFYYYYYYYYIIQAVFRVYYFLNLKIKCIKFTNLPVKYNFFSTNILSHIFNKLYYSWTTILNKSVCTKTIKMWFPLIKWRKINWFSNQMFSLQPPIRYDLSL